MNELSLYNTVTNFFLSKRMKALYWSTANMFFVGFLDLTLQNLTAWNPDNLVTVFAGLVFAQITKYLNNKASNS